MSIPVLILALFVVSLMGSSIRNVVMALSIVFTPRFARIARGEMLRIKTSDYITASHALGARPWRVIRRHGMPNLLAPIIVLASLTFGQAMIAEAGLSFLGVGAPITEPSWGQMLSRSARVPHHRLVDRRLPRARAEHRRAGVQPLRRLAARPPGSEARPLTPVPVVPPTAA